MGAMRWNIGAPEFIPKCEDTVSSMLGQGGFIDPGVWYGDDVDDEAFPFVPEVNSENSHMDCKPGLHPGAIPFVPGTTWVSLSALNDFVFLEATRLRNSNLQEVHDVAVPEDVSEDAKVDTGFEKPASPVPSEDGSSSTGRSSRVRSEYGDEGGSLFVDGARIVD